MPPVQFLVAGSVHGRFDALFARVQKLLVKHNFKALLCVGRFFGQDEAAIQPYLNKEKTVPIPTYFISGEETSCLHLLDAEGGELTENLFYLGRYGVQPIAGLQVAFISGVYNSSLYNAIPTGGDLNNAESVVYYRKEHVEHLLQLASCSPVDVFLSTEFGRGFHTFTQMAADTSEITRSIGSPFIAKIVQSFSPRYHFVSHDQHIVVPPYRNRKPFENVTRCFSLAAFNNKHKHKFLYACGTVPVAKMDADALKDAPEGTTESPYTARVRDREVPAEAPAKRQRTVSSADPFAAAPLQPSSAAFSRWDLSKKKPPSGYICRICRVSGHFIEDCPEAGTTDRRAPPDGYVCKICNDPGHFIGDCPEKARQESTSRGPCWFCLASPEVEAHLIISIGEYCYLALAKGPMNEFHALIVPIDHVKSSISLPDTTASEVAAYKTALKKMFAFLNMSCIMYERNIRTRGASHMHVQVVGVPKDVGVGRKAAKKLQALAKDKFAVEFALLDEFASVRDMCSGGSFTLVEMGDGQRLLHLVEPRTKVPLQFVRESIAELLGRPDTADWKACRGSVDEEKQMVTEFKKAFTSFDIAS